jgi:hypothetical protein
MGFIISVKRISISLGCLLAAFNSLSQITSGPLSPSVAYSYSCSFAFGSTTDYQPETNIMTSDNMYASAAHCDCCDLQTRCIRASGFGFTIPMSATITGIKVEIEKKRSSGGSGSVEDNGLRLTKGGIEAGQNKKTTQNWPLTDAYSSYGGSIDLWGSTWTPAEINDTAFGVVFAGISYVCGTNSVSYIDHLRISVSYTDIPTNIAPGLGKQNVILVPTGIKNEYLIRFHENMKEASCSVIIRDMLGRTLHEARIESPSDQTIINLGDKPTGWYFIETVQDGVFRKNFKILATY